MAGILRGTPGVLDAQVFAYSPRDRQNELTITYRFLDTGGRPRSASIGVTSASGGYEYLDNQAYLGPVDRKVVDAWETRCQIHPIMNGL